MSTRTGDIYIYILLKFEIKYDYQKLQNIPLESFMHNYLLNYFLFRNRNDFISNRI